jgi:Protein of unknown function (DUF3082)
LPPVVRRRDDGPLRVRSASPLLVASSSLLLILSSFPRSRVAALAPFVVPSAVAKRGGSFGHIVQQRGPVGPRQFDRALRPLHLTRQEEELEEKDVANGASAEEDDDDDEVAEEGQALTRTVNQRLLDELREAAEREASGSSALSAKRKNKGGTANPLLGLGSRKSDEERQASIDEARNLNGINPVVAIAGSVFALGVAAALWTLTNVVAESFATHPIESDLYVVQRAAAVFRNVVMGLFALASGFFGVTGVGILLLGVRVAIGVAKGELDPTPLPPPVARPGANDNDQDDRVQVFSKAWDLMTGGGGGRGGRSRRKNDSGSNSK